MTNLNLLLVTFCVLTALIWCEHNEINEHSAEEDTHKEALTAGPDTNTTTTTEEYFHVKYHANRFEGFNETDFGRYLQKKMMWKITRNERFPRYVVMHYYHPQKDVIGKSIKIDPSMIVRPKDKEKQKWWCTGKTEPVFLKNNIVICRATKLVDVCFVEGVKMPCLKEILHIPDCPRNVTKCRRTTPKLLEIPCLTMVYYQKTVRCAIVIYNEIRNPTELTNEEFVWLADNNREFQRKVEPKFVDLLETILCAVFCKN